MALMTSMQQDSTTLPLSHNKVATTPSRRRPRSTIHPMVHSPISPHINVPAGSSWPSKAQQDDSSMSSTLDALTRNSLAQPDLLPPSSFEEFRMPPFDSLAILGHESAHTENREEPRDDESSQTSSLARRTRKSRHNRNTFSLGGTGEDYHSFATPYESPQRRMRNKALGSDQFDEILANVFGQ